MSIAEITANEFAMRNHPTQVLHLVDYQIKFCLGYGDCLKHKPCEIQDDDMNKLEKELETSEGIVIVSPVYIGGVPGKLKTFFDRSVPWIFANQPLQGKVGTGIAVGWTIGGGHEFTLQQINTWMNAHGIYYVTSKHAAKRETGMCKYGTAIVSKLLNKTDYLQKSLTLAVQAMCNLIDKTK